MNKSTSFQPVGGVVFSGKLPRRFPPFLTVWDGQAEREAAFLNIKLHAARFRVCVGLLADRRVAAAVIKQPFLQGGVVGADMDKRVFLVKPNVGGLCFLISPRLKAGIFQSVDNRLSSQGAAILLCQLLLLSSFPDQSRHSRRKDYTHRSDKPGLGIGSR